MRWKISKNWLLVLPAVTLLVSYVYLAIYHGKWWLFATIVHESGNLTLAETIFYAAHFVGHMPSLTVAALLMVGSLRMFSIQSDSEFERRNQLLIYLALFVVGNLVLAIFLSGWETSWQYLAQQRQGELRLERGGSWLLHLPTTMLLFAAIPLYAGVLLPFLGRGLDFSNRGRAFFGVAAAVFTGMTLLVCATPLSAIAHVWTDARYLAHSVRELATYPLLIFPGAIFLFVDQQHSTEKNNPKALRLLWGLAIICILAICWKVAVALSTGVGAIAQKPDFARGGELSIAYLLASHYFEHVLDTIYFVLLCAVLNAAGRRAPVQKVLR